MPAWPVKTRELHNHHFDSTVWNDFAFRDDDVVISTYGKSGTTWVQQIVAQLIFQRKDHPPVGELSPWLDLRVPPKEVKLAALEAQTHRRFIKTHLPVDALGYSPRAKYIYIGRDGRDVVWSLYNHHSTATDEWYRALNDTPGRVGPPVPRPPASIVQYFREWLDGDGYPFWPFWENVRSWWDIRELPNLMLLHFADLKADLPGQMRRIAAFLDIRIDEAAWPAMLDHCTFGYMKGHPSETAPAGGRFWTGGGAAFFNKGTNGRWREVLPQEDSRRYEATASRELPPPAPTGSPTGRSPARRREVCAGKLLPPRRALSRCSRNGTGSRNPPPRHSAERHAADGGFQCARINSSPDSAFERLSKRRRGFQLRNSRQARPAHRPR